MDVTESWRYRDWVVDALTRDLPYDRFITEQIAGDLLPNPTLEQRIATGFNRNHRGNAEGGIIPEEYAVEYVVDRVDTTATVGSASVRIASKILRGSVAASRPEMNSATTVSSNGARTPSENVAERQISLRAPTWQSMAPRMFAEMREAAKPAFTSGT